MLGEVNVLSRPREPSVQQELNAWRIGALSEHNHCLRSLINEKDRDLQDAQKQIRDLKEELQHAQQAAQQPAQEPAQEPAQQNAAQVADQFNVSPQEFN